MSERQPPPEERVPAEDQDPAPPDGLGQPSSATPIFWLPGRPPAGPPAAPWPHPGPAPASPQPPVQPQPPVHPGPVAHPPPVAALGPRPSRLPALVTAAVLLLVAAVVAAGTLAARHADTHVVPRTAPAAPARPASPPPGPGSIDFSTAYGAGRLSVLDHTWSSSPSGSHLRIRVELRCTRGSVEHAPEYFSLFDDQGRLVERSAAREPDPVPLGSIGAGERVRGYVSFDLPHGEVTLVLSDDLSSVTAVRITD